MKIGLIVFAGWLLSIANGSHAEGPKRYWILVEVAPIWSKPKAQSTPVANLRTGTWFTSGKRSEDWVYIDSLYSHPLRGWVHASMVSEIEVDSSYLVEQLRNAKTFADTVKWCERLVSLLPHNRPYMKALQKGYLALGDTIKAAYLGRRIRGTNSIYLAHNDGRDILVLGSLDSTGEFSGLLWKEHPTGQDRGKYAPISKAHQAIKSKANKLKIPLSSMDWYSIDGRNSSPSPVKNMATIPRIVPGPGNMEGYYTDIGDVATFGLSLGAFNDYFLNGRAESAILATSPIFAVPTSGLIRQTEFDSLSWYRKQLVGNAFDSNGVTGISYRKLIEYDYLELVVAGILANPRATVDQQGVFDPKRKLIWPPERATGSEYWHAKRTPKAEPLWFRFGESPAFPAFCIVPITTTAYPPDFQPKDGEFGYHLLRVSKSGSKSFAVRMDYSGD